jgi:hypothetical protein
VGAEACPRGRRPRLWFDFDRIGPGDTFDPKVQENIGHCSLFLAVLSRTTETRTEGFFRREWDYALDRDRGIRRGTRFIIPVAIDDTPKFTTVDPRFNAIDISRLLDGNPTPAFIDRLKGIIGSRR